MTAAEFSGRMIRQQEIYILSFPAPTARVYTASSGPIKFEPIVKPIGNDAGADQEQPQLRSRVLRPMLDYPVLERLGSVVSLVDNGDYQKKSDAIHSLRFHTAGDFVADSDRSDSGETHFDTLCQLRGRQCHGSDQDRGLF